MLSVCWFMLNINENNIKYKCFSLKVQLYMIPGSKGDVHMVILMYLHVSHICVLKHKVVKMG